MSEELQNSVDNSTLQQDNTVLPVDEQQPENSETGQPDQSGQPVKTFTQEELDSIIGKRLAQEQRRWERNQAKKTDTQPTSVDNSEQLSIDQFESVDEYVEALAVRKAEQLVADRQEREYRSKLSDSYYEIENKIRDKYDDFDQVAYNPNIVITPTMAESIYLSEIGPEIAYYLGSNPQESARISKLTAIAQAKEVGKLEAKLIATPPVKNTTNATTPIKPVTSNTSTNVSYDTTDPRSVKNMSTSDWIAADRERQIKKLGATRNH